MAIPAFQSYLLPALRALGNGEVWSNGRMSEELSLHFKLTPEDKANLLPSGVRPRYRDRAIWALTYLFHAGLARRPTRGKYEITPAGVSLLNSNPKEITQRFLIDNYPGFRAFATQSSGTESKGTMPSGVAPTSAAEQTPSDRFETAFNELQASLVSELLDRLASLSPEGFEHAVLKLLRAMGYAADEQSVQHTGQSGDEGIDGIIYQDPMGLDRVYVQAKNWANPVSGPDLSKFVGAMDLQGASKGVFVTRSTFTTQANSFAEKSMKRIVLVDGSRFAKLMIQYGVGVTTVRSYQVCRADADFFDEAAE
jgi:restriction system protein